MTQSPLSRSPLTQPVVTVLGGSGFIGRHLVQRLAARGWTVRVGVRDPEAALFLKPLGNVGQIVALPADVMRPETLGAAMAGADCVVNLVGILFERTRRTFEAVHVKGAANVARAAQEAGVKRLIHMSALGADAASDSDYARTKAKGEAAVRAAFADATIVRPGVVFGPEDNFFNMFAGLAMVSPVLPVIGAPFLPGVRFGGENGIDIDFFGAGGPKFQPVFVGDVAEAMARMIERDDTRTKTFELAGPGVYSFKQLMEQLMAATGRKRWLMPVHYVAAEAMGFFMEFLPKPMLTRDQVTLLRHDNVAAGQAPGLLDLGIDAKSLGAVLPTYLGRFRPPAKQRTRAT